MISTLAWMFFVLVFIKSSHSELVYDWKEIDVEPIAIQNWRPTSFAVTKDKIFLTLVDVNKQTAGNGLVGWFNKSKYFDVSYMNIQYFIRHENSPSTTWKVFYG